MGSCNGDLEYYNPDFMRTGTMVTTILLPLQNTSTERGKILIAGGDVTASDPALRTVEIVDFNAGNFN